jgi:sucrose-6-phosphate hydrolase SacC (GH32 family)
LEKLRHSHQRFERSLESVTETAGTAPIFGKQMEIKARFEMDEAESFGFNLLDDENEYRIAFEPSSRRLQVLEESTELQFVEDEQPVELHIFIDHSVVEVFINAREAFTAVFRPELADFHNLKISPFVTQGKGQFSIDAWKLNDALVTGSVSSG